jgi:hypothetical protein
MKDVIERPGHVYVFRHVAFEESKLRIAEKMGNIIAVASDKVVNTYHLVPFLYKVVA